MEEGEESLEDPMACAGLSKVVWWDGWEMLEVVFWPETAKDEGTGSSGGDVTCQMTEDLSGT
jgi:hypothetical protein